MVVVLEMGKFTWMLNSIVPGVDRRSLKKLSVNKDGLLSQLHSWRDEAEKKSGCRISRICLSYEAGRDGFWLAHWLQDHGIEAHVMHPISLNSAVGARQSSGKLLMLNQCLCLESSTMANPFGEAL